MLQFLNNFYTRFIQKTPIVFTYFSRSMKMDKAIHYSSIFPVDYLLLYNPQFVLKISSVAHTFTIGLALRHFDRVTLKWFFFEEAFI